MREVVIDYDIVLFPWRQWLYHFQSEEYIFLSLVVVLEYIVSDLESCYSIVSIYVMLAVFRLA